MSPKIVTFVLGPIETNTYLVLCDGDCWIVDPGFDPGKLIEHLSSRSLTPSRILLTHGHGDHIAGAGPIKAAWPEARLCCPRGDVEMLSDPQANMSGPFGLAVTSPPADEMVGPGMSLNCGTVEWRILDTSGHTPGGVSYYCPRGGVVLTGDSLFAGSMGRTDIPGASASRLISNIRAQLMTLPQVTQVLPGHGPATTIGDELATNPFLTT